MVDRKEITCIACPMDCRLGVWRDEGGAVCVENYACKRGVAYGEQEFVNPMRTVTSSVLVAGGCRPLCAVKTRGVVPKGKIPEILRCVAAARAEAPVRIGQVILADIAGTGVDLVATAECGARER